MSDKLLHNRLNSLFADLEEINELPAPIRDSTGAEGWTFSCDGEKRYTDCSPEVEKILGISAAHFIGEFLPQFALTAESANRLSAWLEKDDIPEDLEVEFMSTEEEIVRVRLHIHKTSSQNSPGAELSGFTQVIDRVPGLEARHAETGSSSGVLGEPVLTISEEDVKPGQAAEKGNSTGPLGVQEHSEDESESLKPDQELAPPEGFSPPEALFSGSETDIFGTHFEQTGDGEPDLHPYQPAPPVYPEDSTLDLIEEDTDLIDRPVETIEDQSELAHSLEPLAEAEVFDDGFEIDEVDFDDEAEELDVQPFKTLPDLSGIYPDASPDAFTSHFQVDGDESIEQLSNAGPLDSIQSDDQVTGLPIETQEPPLPSVAIDDEEVSSHVGQPDPGNVSGPVDGRDLSPETNPQEVNGGRPPELTSDHFTSYETLEPTDGSDGDKLYAGGGKTRPFDNLDTLIAALPHTVTGPQPLAETGPLPGSPGSAKKQIPSKGTGILRLSEAIPRSGTDLDPAVLTVPIHMQERSIGLLEIIDDTPFRDWSEDERRLVEEIADQLSLALENARLFAQTQKALDETESQAQRLARLNEMSELLSRASHLDEVFAVAGRKTASIIPSERVSLALIEGDSLTFNVIALHDEHGLTSPNGSLPLERAAIEIAIQKRQLVFLPRGGDHGNRDLSAVLVAPLLASGKLIGTINVGKKTTGTYSKQDENLLVQVASLLASTIEGRRLLEQTEQALSETEALFQAGAELNAVQSFDDILSILRRYTIVGDQARHAAVFLFDRPWQGEDIPAWQIRIAHWSNSPAHKGSRRLPLGEWKAAAEILHQEVPTIIPETRANPALWAEDSPMRAELGTAKSALIIPLNVGRQWIGYIFVSYSEARDFPGVNIRRLTSLAGQAAVAIENLRLLEETLSRARQLQTAAEIARDASETLAVEELLNRAVKLIADRFGFYHTSIYLLDESGENAVISASGGQAGLDPSARSRQFPVGSKSVVGYVTQTGPLVLNDVRQSPIHEPNPDLPETRAELGIPLKVGERIIGALDVQSTQENPFTPDDVAVLQTLTDQIAVAVDNARSYELAQEAIQEARQRLQELSMLYTVSQSFASAPLEIAEIANLVARQFVKLLHVPECSVSILEEDGESLRILVAIQITDDGEFIDLEDVGRIVPVSEYPGGKQTLKTMSPLVVNLTSADSDPDLQARLTREGYLSQVIIPLAAKGQPIGIIELKSQIDERLTTPGELNLAMTLANQAAVALENASLYNEQRRTADQLREVDTLKTQFLANMSHELRTPLNSIIGFSRVILKGIDGPVTNLQEQDLTAIYNAGQHLLGLINDILDLSKIEAGKMELSFEIINLVDLINSVMSTAVGLVKHKPIQLLKDLPKDLPPVNVDPLRIRQVLLNLLSNAAKFTEEGSITVSAALQEADSETGPQILVRVTDTGPGISQEDQKKLFQPFTQVDASPTRKTGGSGLGLSISLHLIEMHGGMIDVESEPEKGSTFSFSLSAVDPDELDGQVPRPINYIRQTGPLPALPDKAYEQALVIKETGELRMPVETPDKQEVAVMSAADPVALSAETPPPTRTSDGLIILAIDKDPQIVGLYERYLQPSGFQVIPSSDSEQALAFAKANKPALITLDVMASQYDGWQLLKALKEDPDTGEIPVIICSIIEEREKAIFYGASDYLVKPILEADLIEAVEKLVQSTIPPDVGQVEEHPAIDVLIVDQDSDDIRVLEMLLQENGNFQVSEAADGRQALEAILTEPPDIIILNHLLPDMDAVTFIRTLRANPTIRSLPIVLLTETELPAVMKQQLARNCQAIFHKAKINPDALLASLREATG